MAIACDKATPSRNTVQCVVIIAPYNGVKTVFPIGAPPVYKNSATEDNEDAEDNEDEGESTEIADDMLVGGSSEQLAGDIADTLTSKLNFDCKSSNVAGKIKFGLLKKKKIQYMYFSSCIYYIM